MAIKTAGRDKRQIDHRTCFATRSVAGPKSRVLQFHSPLCRMQTMAPSCSLTRTGLIADPKGPSICGVSVALAKRALSPKCWQCPLPLSAWSRIAASSPSRAGPRRVPPGSDLQRHDQGCGRPRAIWAALLTRRDASSTICFVAADGAADADALLLETERARAAALAKKPRLLQTAPR